MDIKAQAIHSGMTREEIDIALENCAYADYKFLYISPERIATPLFKSRIQKLNVNLLAVDEAHCISQWGYDFRPSYLKIAELSEMLPPGIPILALTATATSNVVKGHYGAGSGSESLIYSKPVSATEYIIHSQKG
jgi:ATP-dependent DNA helicase RecQ